MVYSGYVRSPTGFGRPRDDDATDRILDAGFVLFGERGYAGATVGAVASRAGVGVKTIYRRFANRDEMILGCLEGRLELGSVPNSGDTYVDLLSMIAPTTSLRVRRILPRVRVAVMLEEERHPEFLMAYRRFFVWPFRRAVMSVLVRAVRRGEFRDDVDLDVVIDLLSGMVDARMLSGGSFEEGITPAVLGIVMDGCALRRGGSTFGC